MLHLTSFFSWYLYYSSFFWINSNSNLACIWKGNKCEDRLGVRVVDRLCHKNQDCDSKEICASLHSSSDPCLDDSLGQCIPKPNDCPSTNEKVCGCDGRTYWNQCECLEAKENVKYSGSCSDSRDRAFRRYVRDIDDGDFTDDLLVQFIFSSVSTDGDTCLTELECKKQIRDINHLNNFRVVSDPNNCGCYELNGSGYWSDSNQCSAQEKKVDLDGNRKRIHCDLNRIYRDVRNVPLDTCLTMSGCNDQCEHDYRRGADIETNPYSSKCGCYMNMQKNQCHWNSCGDNIKKASDHLPGDNTRVWCVDRARDVRDIVYDTCLTRDECEEQGEFNGNVKTPANVKDFDSESICGCYSKGGDLYWARCDIHGNFYGELNNQKERIHCQDVGSRSYRIFDEGHTHFVSNLLFFFQCLLRWHTIARFF